MHPSLCKKIMRGECLRKMETFHRIEANISRAVNGNLQAHIASVSLKASSPLHSGSRDLSSQARTYPCCRMRAASLCHSSSDSMNVLTQDARDFFNTASGRRSALSASPSDDAITARFRRTSVRRASESGSTPSDSN